MSRFIDCLEEFFSSIFQDGSGSHRERQSECHVVLNAWVDLGIGRGGGGGTLHKSSQAINLGACPQIIQPFVTTII